jgi:hypothetical protein
MHKNPVKLRFIVASKRCVTKQVAKRLTKILKLVQQQQRNYCRTVEWSTGVNMMWITDNNEDILSKIEKINKRKSAKDISTFDFSTLYTKIEPEDLKDKLKEVVNHVFRGGCSQKITVTDKEAAWELQKRSRKKGTTYSKEQIHEMIDYIIDNSVFKVGDKVMRQKIGIPMGTDPAPYFANLYLFFYESKWIRKMMKIEFGTLRKFYNYVNRFIDDLITINNNGHMEIHWKDIYPAELQLNKENDMPIEATFLDLRLEIVDREVITSVYDKRDNFPFEIICYPDLSGNISCKTGYACYIGQFIRITRNSRRLEDAVDRIQDMIKKMLTKQYTVNNLKHTTKKCLNNHRWICEKYDVQADKIIQNIF